jgi:probable HAF family extracellular repeat protein
MTTPLRRAALMLGLLTALSACADPTDLPTSVPIASADSPPGRGVITQSWPITSLGVLGSGDYSAALDINAASTVVGYSAYDNTGNVHAFLWTQGNGMIDLGTLGVSFGFFQSAATAINDQGEVVGWSDKSYGGLLNRAIYWSPATGMVELPSDTQYQARAYDINSLGVVIGCGVPTGDSLGQVLRWHRNAKGVWIVAALGEPAAAGGESCGYGINAAGNVVGYYPPGGFPLTGFRYVKGTYTSQGLGTKPNRIVGPRFVGAGGITGAGGVPNPGAGLPWEWPSLTATPFSLGYLYQPLGEAFDLNASNHIVGTIAGPPTVQRH